MTNATRELGAARLARALFLSMLCAASAGAQDRLRSMPGYERYQRMSPLIRTAVAPSPMSFRGVTWSADGRSVEYDNDGKHYRFDLATKKAVEIGDAVQATGGVRGRGGGGEKRGGRCAAAEDSAR